jgi:bifunctional oligoribonuclease and PAP phosphatase NrnA
MQNNSSSFIKLRNMLTAGGTKHILILSHRNPDGDAIGASLALYNIFLQMEHKVDIIVPNAFPKFLKWMQHAGKIRVYSNSPTAADKILIKAEIIFALDFNDLGRIQELEKALKQSGAFKVLIDHHPDPRDFADLVISDATSSSTAELVYDFIISMDLSSRINKPVADCIYAGIMTDTGCFSYNSSQPETFNKVASLLSYGIDKDYIYDRVYNTFSFDRMRLMGYCLNEKTEYLPQYATAYITLTQAELKEYNFRIGDAEGFVNLPLSIEGIRFSALFIEKQDMIKISLRSKGNFAVNEIASLHFHGGGHKNAAGGESYESMQKTVDKFVNLLQDYKDDLLEK